MERITVPGPDGGFSVPAGLEQEAAERLGRYEDAYERLTARRSELAIRLQQAILDDNAYVFCSFLEMNMISRSHVTGYTAHACDYYQVTADLDIQR